MRTRTDELSSLPRTMNDIARLENPLRHSLLDERTGDACAVVIFGASGDMTRRKLMPALYNLAVSHVLPGNFGVVGVARRTKTQEQFTAEMKDGVAKYSRRKLDPALWDDFGRSISYVCGDFNVQKTYEDLRAHLQQIDADRGTRGNRLFYLAVPPAEFGPIL